MGGRGEAPKIGERGTTSARFFTTNTNQDSATTTLVLHPVSIVFATTVAMPGSVASDESGDDVFIVDIDQIQAHGISAVDITKLKTNGYYTVAVRAFGRLCV
ncbi:hypothetical protein IWX90DRAFT_241822 [Phyllosticta citrichinensis]|uniref:Uncharacterized protein n=1 Tax=Phyllosticta citrichinensis TaxID=1130410 RepID=A0ABR1XQK7_9PEZI